MEPQVSPTVSIPSDDVTDCTELDAEYDSDCDRDVDMCMAHDVDAPAGVDMDGDVDMERDGDTDDEEEEEKEDEEEVEEEKEHEERDQDEHDGKQHRTISQGEIVITLANDVHTVVDDQLIVLPEIVQEMCEHTSRPQPLTPARQLQTLEPSPCPRTVETHPICGLEHLGLVTQQNPRPAVLTLLEDRAAVNTLDVDVDLDVDQQLMTDSAGGD